MFLGTFIIVECLPLCRFLNIFERQLFAFGNFRRNFKRRQECPTVTVCHFPKKLFRIRCYGFFQIR